MGYLDHWKNILSSELSSDQGNLNLYAQIIRENLESVGDRLRKSMFFMFGLMGLFEIIKRTSSGQEISFWIIKIKDNELVSHVVPFFVAFLFYEVTSLFAFRKILIKAHRIVLEKKNSKFINSPLAEFLIPISTFSLSLSILPKKRQFFLRYGGMIGILSTFVPIIFILYAYLHCWRKFGFNLLLGISSVLSVFFIINGIYFRTKVNNANQ